MLTKFCWLQRLYLYKTIIFHLWWFTRGEIPPLFVLLKSSRRLTPAAPCDPGGVVGWEGKGFQEVSSTVLRSPPGELQRLLATLPSGSSTSCQSFPNFTLPPPFSHPCCRDNPLWNGEPNFPWWCSMLSRPTTSSPLTRDHYFSSFQGLVCGQQATQRSLNALQQYLTFGLLLTQAAPRGSYKIPASTYFLNQLSCHGWEKGIAFCSCLVERERSIQPSVFLHTHCKYKCKYLCKYLCFSWLGPELTPACKGGNVSAG